LTWRIVIMNTNKVNSVRADDKVTPLRAEDPRDAIIALLEVAWERFVAEDAARDEAAGDEAA
jgi:hypothetical protein